MSVFFIRIATREWGSLVHTTNMHDQLPHQPAASHQACYFLLRYPEQVGLQILPPQSLVGPDMEVDLDGDPRHPDADEVVHANAATLRKVWRSLVQHYPDK